MEGKVWVVDQVIIQAEPQNREHDAKVQTDLRLLTTRPDHLALP